MYMTFIKLIKLLVRYLDIALVNQAWLELYRDAEIKHLQIIGSDRGPIILFKNPKRKHDRKFPFRLQQNGPSRQLP